MEDVADFTLLNLVWSHLKADQVENALDFISRWKRLSSQDKSNHERMNPDRVRIGLTGDQLHDSVQRDERKFIGS